MLKTKYLGLDLKSPIIVGASEMTSNVDKIKRLEEAGAAAIVTKSLFEEEIILKNNKWREEISQYDDINAEMGVIFPDMDVDAAKEHLYWVNKTKEAVSIPVIASLNCVNKEAWIEYAKELEQAGADAIEANMYSYSFGVTKNPAEIEDKRIGILKEIKKVVNIPVSVKISPHYTSIFTFVTNLDQAGVDGVVLFNRLFNPDIDIEKEVEVSRFHLTDSSRNGSSLRWIGLLSGKVGLDLCANNGVESGEDMIKMILAGASAVEVVSTVYRHGMGQIGVMEKTLTEWMERKGYNSIDEFKGKLSKVNISNPWAYERTQYIKMLLKGEYEI